MQLQEKKEIYFKRRDRKTNCFFQKSSDTLNQNLKKKQFIEHSRSRLKKAMQR